MHLLWLQLLSYSPICLDYNMAKITKTIAPNQRFDAKFCVDIDALLFHWLPARRDSSWTARSWQPAEQQRINLNAKFWKYCPKPNLISAFEDFIAANSRWLLVAFSITLTVMLLFMSPLSTLDYFIEFCIDFRDSFLKLIPLEFKLVWTVGSGVIFCHPTLIPIEYSICCPRSHEKEGTTFANLPKGLFCALKALCSLLSEFLQR